MISPAAAGRASTAINKATVNKATDATPWIVFGFRVSDFFRPSGFGFRISGSAGPSLSVSTGGSIAGFLAEGRELLKIEFLELACLSKEQEPV